MFVFKHTTNRSYDLPQLIEGDKLTLHMKKGSEEYHQEHYVNTTVMHYDSYAPYYILRIDLIHHDENVYGDSMPHICSDILFSDKTVSFLESKQPYPQSISGYKDEFRHMLLVPQTELEKQYESRSPSHWNNMSD
jgi:hypothetical protein